MSKKRIRWGKQGGDQNNKIMQTRIRNKNLKRKTKVSVKSIYRKCIKLNKHVKYKTGMEGKNSLSCLLDLKSGVKTCFPNVSKDMTHQP